MRALRFRCREAWVAAVLVLVLALATADGALAKSRRYAVSKSPYPQVGRLDPALSGACRRRVFNQRDADRLYIGFQGARGRGTTGIARKGWNLRDPRGLARPGVTYHFWNDGYADCRVYVSAGRAR